MQNENEYTDANGVRYVAKAADKSDGCRGCAHFPALSSECLVSSACGQPGRSDSIIWVKAEEVSQA